MQTFDQHLFQLYHDKKISLEEALRNADSQNNLRLRIKLAENPQLEEQVSPFGAAREEDENSDDTSMKLRLDS